MLVTRFYHLVKKQDRALMLIGFEEIIQRAYRIVCPTVKVEVYNSHYTVTGNITRGQLIAAGRKIAKNPILGNCCVSYKNTNQVFRCYKTEEK